MIDRLVPWFETDLTDDRILSAYSVEDRDIPHFRMNFVSTLDGAAAVNGRTGSLGGDADKRVFDLLRRLADVVLVGAGTVRIEKYGAMRLSDESTEWRQSNGLDPQPVFGIVSGRLALDPSSPIFTDAPVRPLVLTVETAPAEQREALADVADVVDCGVGAFDPLAMMTVFRDRGESQIHGEGGPSLFGTMLAADVVDELCLTYSPELVAGDAPRIAEGEGPALPATMTLASLLRQEGVLLARYLRDRSA